MTNDYTFEAVGFIRSRLINLTDAPRQGDEGNYEAWLDIRPEFAKCLEGINIEDSLLLLTWLHLAKRDVLQVYPRGNIDRALTGVFATRSSDRPNPIGLHQVSVLEIGTQSLRVAPLEAINGTPIVDIKPVLTELKNR